MAVPDVSRLQEDKEYLELKLKYVQSVSTIFRQKVAVLLRNVWGSPQRGHEEPGDDEGHVTALREMMAEMEANEASPPRQSLVETERSEYWRERFLRAMEETRPTNLQEAQTLCTLLQERNEMAESESDLKRRLSACDTELAKMKENYLRVLNDRAISADEAVVERFKYKEAELMALNPTGVNGAMEQAQLARDELQKVHAKAKVLRLRNSQLQNDLEQSRGDLHALHEQHRCQIAELTSANKELRSKLAIRDGEARRADTGRIKAEQSVLLKDSTISRLESRICALEKEVDAVLKEGTGSVDTNEGAILRRQIDTFELKLRECEEVISVRDTKILELEHTTDVLRETIDAKQLQIDAKQRLAETLQRRLETQDIDATQRAAHTNMIQTFEERMLQAVTDISARQNATELAVKVASLQGQVETLTSVQTSLKATKDELNRTKKQLDAYRTELSRCMKLERIPTVDVVEEEIVKSDLRPVADGGDGHRAGVTGEVILRTQGKWKEVRDLNSGTVYFVTSDASVTPFKTQSLRAPSPPKVASKPPTPRSDVTPASTATQSAAASPAPATELPDDRSPNRSCAPTTDLPDSSAADTMPTQSVASEQLPSVSEQPHVTPAEPAMQVDPPSESNATPSRPSSSDPVMSPTNDDDLSPPPYSP